MVDILMATYNGEKFIRQQIESIIKQTFIEWNLYIHDDGSTDNTIAIIKSFDDERIHFIEDDHHFGSSSLNFLHLTNYVKSDYFFFSDQDDFWLPIKLQKTLSFIKQIENGEKMIPACVGTDLKIVDSRLSVISESFYDYSKLLNDADFNSLLIENDFTGCTMCMNRAVVPYLKTLKNEEFSKILQHDWLVALICAADGKVAQLKEQTMLYRQHQNNAVGANAFSVANIFRFSTLRNRFKKIKKLKASVYEQLQLTAALIKNERKKNLIEKYVSSTGIKHKIFIIKNKINRSINIVKSLEKLFLY